MVEIVRTRFESANDSDFVAIGNLLRQGESMHAAFVIQYQTNLFAFHYTGLEIEYGRLGEDYYHIESKVIHRDEVPAFIAQCKNILRNANPTYGYFYSGQSYDESGHHISENELGEVMTCAGFCLNVLKGFLEEDYLAYADWANIGYPNATYVEDFCRRHGLDPDKIQGAHRRITPRECLISCLFDQLPIRKSQIDAEQPRVQAYFDQRLGLI